jgi:hypothetical protein
MRILANDAIDDSAQGWEHVSVSFDKRTPSWSEMAWVKDQFWMDFEAVFQLHPPKKDYVNRHEHCLHLWRNIFVPCPLPPLILI